MTDLRCVAAKLPITEYRTLDRLRASKGLTWTGLIKEALELYQQKEMGNNDE